MKFLITTTDIYRCDNEAEAQLFIEELKNRGLDIISSTIQKKERKQKGEVIDEWTRLTVKINYNDEKEPVDEYFGSMADESEDWDK